MPRTLASLLTAVPFALALAGCAAAPAPAAQAPAAMAAPAPAPLARSYFSADRTGAISEDDLQHVLSAPVDLQFPARVGVVPLSQPFDAQGHATMRMRADASRDFAAALMHERYYSHVSDVSTELPNAGGIEGLRALAARYRLRYLLLYTERFDDATHLNGLAWLYPTLLGMFVAPGVTVESHGMVQADLLDVRTGTILFSVLEPVHVASKQFMVGAARAHEELQATAAAEAAKRLAVRVTGQTAQLLAYADEMSTPGAKERHPTRMLPAPVLADQAVPRVAEPTAAAARR